MRIAPSGQDIRFDEKQIEEGRNFANKLWNAARFRQMQGGETEGEIDPRCLTSDDKWILLRLDAAIRAVTQALEGYNFNEAAQALYRFFWSEFCDWYLEASKASLGSARDSRASLGDPPSEPGAELAEEVDGESPSTARESRALPGDGGTPQKTNTLAVIDFILGHALRLFHPFMPFITEELWHGLGFNADLPEEQGATTIQFARWPQPLDDDFKKHYGLTPNDEQFANAKYETVIAGRRLRRDFNIASNKRVVFVLVPPSPLPDEEAAVLRILLNAERLDLPQKYEADQGNADRAHAARGTLSAAGRLDRSGGRTAAARQGDREDRSRAGNGAKKIGEPKFRRQRAGRSRGRASAAGKRFCRASRAARADAGLVRVTRASQLARVDRRRAGSSCAPGLPIECAAALYSPPRKMIRILKFLLWLGIGASRRRRGRGRWPLPAANRSTRSGS